MRCRGKNVCGRGDITDRLFAVGRQSLARDINLVRLVRSMRVMERFVEETLNKSELAKLKHDAHR